MALGSGSLGSKLSRGSLTLTSLGPCRMRDCSGPMVYNLSHIKRVLDLAATAICFGLKNQFFIERERERECVHGWVGVCARKKAKREREIKNDHLLELRFLPHLRHFYDCNRAVKPNPTKGLNFIFCFNFLCFVELSLQG